jgi:hypothetical protein
MGVKNDAQKVVPLSGCEDAAHCKSALRENNPKPANGVAKLWERDQSSRRFQRLLPARWMPQLITSPRPCALR